MPPKKNPDGANNRKSITVRYLQTAQEYQELLQEIGWSQEEVSQIFDFAVRTSRRYKRGDAPVPLELMKFLRLVARGVLTKRQVIQA